jgi:hypothetical protein
MVLGMAHLRGNPPTAQDGYILNIFYIFLGNSSTLRPCLVYSDAMPTSTEGSLLAEPPLILCGQYEVKQKLTRYTLTGDKGERRYSSCSFLTLALDGSE